MDECRREPFKTREGREITGPWQSHPKRMLRHKAMIQCARLAFGFAGIYDKDEAERIVENTAYTAERQPERDITPVAELEAWVEYTRAAYVRAKDKGDLIRVITRQPTGFYAYVPCN